MDGLLLSQSLGSSGDESSCKVGIVRVYSGASLNGPSQKRTTSLERTHTNAPIDFSMLLM